MDRIDGAIVASATDVVAFLACRHVTELDRQVAEGGLDAPQRSDAMLDLLRQRGLHHEEHYLEQLRAAGLEVVEIADGAPEPLEPSPVPLPKVSRRDRLSARAVATVEAMKAGTPVVYQATFFDDADEVWWRGHADFLRKVDQQTDLGDWGYEPEDTKLSGHVSANAVLQLCFYAELLREVQGVEVDAVHVVLGNGVTSTVRLAEVAAYYRSVRERFVGALGDNAGTYPLPTDHCRICRWVARCHERWEVDDHLTRVAFMTVEQTRRLAAVGITTLAGLATSDPKLVVPGIGLTTLRRLQQQARLQHQAVFGQPPPWELVEPIEEGKGLTALPEPSPGDVFYDIEGHPYALAGGLEYLHGLGWMEGDSFAFEGWWAHDEHEERAVFEQLIDFIVARRAADPGMHVYHYAPYEITAIRRMMSKYGTREAEVDDLLRNEVFVDLYRVVRQGVRVGVKSYSIKRLEPLYMPPRDDEIGDGGSSVVAYEQWLQSGDQSILDAILAYNQDDVVSNRLLRDWLEGRRSDAVASGLEIPRPVMRDVPSESMDAELAELIARLNAGRYDTEDES